MPTLVTDRPASKTVAITTSIITQFAKLFSRFHPPEIDLYEGYDTTYTHESKLSDEQLRVIFEGQQIHMLNQLLILIAREVKVYYDQLRLLNPNGNAPVNLGFSAKTVSSYFPDMEPKESSGLSHLIRRRLDEYPYISHNKTRAGKINNKPTDTGSRQIRYVDVFQLTFDVWNDWRSNQELKLKAGVIPPRKINPNFYNQEAQNIERIARIWDDKLPGFEGLIRLAGLETLAAWKMVMGNLVNWEREPQGFAFDDLTPEFTPKISDPLVALLLHPDNIVCFERLVMFRLTIDDFECDPGISAILGALVSGRLDIFIQVLDDQNNRQAVVIDLKRTVEEAPELETLLTKFQAWVAQITTPGIRACPTIPMSILVKTLEDASVPVLHMNPRMVHQERNGFVFSAQEQDIFNIWDALSGLGKIIKHASTHPSLYEAVLALERKNSQTPVTRRLQDQPEPSSRLILPTTPQGLRQYLLSLDETTVAFPSLKEPQPPADQLPLPGWDTIAMSPLNHNLKKRFRKKLGG